MSKEKEKQKCIGVKCAKFCFDSEERTYCGEDELGTNGECLGEPWEVE